MFFPLAVKMSLRNMRRQHRLYAPFLLGLSLMGALYLSCQIVRCTDYVQNRHPQMNFIFAAICYVTAFLCVAFACYGNRFILKSRLKELGLYMTCGMNKWQLTFLLLTESVFIFCVISLLGSIFGFTLSKLLFLVTGHLSEDIPSLGTLHFSGLNMLDFMLLNAILCLCMGVPNSLHIYKSSASRLIFESKDHEKPVKAKVFSAMLGLLLLVLGYGLALIYRNMGNAISQFLLAIFVVMGGMYLSFRSLITFILLTLRRIPRFYYQPKHYISVAAMLSRFRSHAIGLASISVMLTGIIMGISFPAAMYFSLQHGVRDHLPLKFEKIYHDRFSHEELTAREKKDEAVWRAMVEKRLPQGASLGKSWISESYQTRLFYRDGCFLTQQDMDRLGAGEEAKKTLEALPELARFVTVSSYSDCVNSGDLAEEVRLAPGEMLVLTAPGMSLRPAEVKWGGRSYKMRYIERAFFREIVQVCLNDEDFVRSQRIAPHDLPAFGSAFNQSWSWKAQLQGMKISEEQQLLTDLAQDYNAQNPGQRDGTLRIDGRADMYYTFIQMNGQLFILGTYVSLAFLIGILIILYYKQLTEAMAERKNTEILRAAGIDRRLVRSCHSQQLLWIFFLPLGMAILNNIAAAKTLSIIVSVLSGFYTTYLSYMKIVGTVTVLLSLFYLAAFRFTLSTFRRVEKTS